MDVINKRTCGPRALSGNGTLNRIGGRNANESDLYTLLSSARSSESFHYVRLL